MSVKSGYESCLPSSCCRGHEEATPRDAHVTGSSCCRGHMVAESRDVHHVTGSMDGSTSENIQVSVATSGARSCCTIERLMKMADRRLFLKEKCRSSKCHWCRSVCAQTILVLVNFFFLVIGWTIAAFGMWLHLSQDSLFYAHLLRDNPSNSFVTFDRLAILLIWSGGFLAAISFLGCCGACAESICFLGFFCLLLLLVIIAEVLLVSWSTVFQNKLVQQMSQGMIYQLQNEYNKTALRNNGSSLEILQLTVAWNTLQTKFNCCGVIGPQDYLRSVWFNSSQDTDGIFVPESCCVSVVVSDDSTYTTDNYCQIDAILFPKDRNYSHYLKTQGCHRVVTDWLLSYSDQSSTTLIITATIQVVVLVLACELIRWVQKQQSDHRWQNDDSCYE